MTRSADALRRRAEKRQLSVDEMKALEMSRVIKKPRTKNSENTVDDIPKKQKISAENWKCSKCNNNNFATSILCNRCQRPKDEVVAVDQPGAGNALTPPTSVATQSVLKTEHKVERTSHVPQMVTKKKSAKSPKSPIDGETVKKSKWLGVEQATEIDILQGQLLRDAYNDETKRSFLTAEELERAQVLIARSQRKKEKKEQYHQYKERQLRREQSAARASHASK
jgi:hypothetical protein